MSKEVNFETLRTDLNSLLKKAFLENNITLLQNQYERNKSVEIVDQKAALDQVFRDTLLEILEDNYNVELLQKYINFCIETCRLNMTTATMPVVLLGDIFDALTLDKSEEMFTFVEQGVHIWKEDLFFSACKNNLLRMCNDLLRRLSRSQNTVFCGRILLFLAKFFPFSERSGLNIVSEFNLDNLTEFGSDNSTSNADFYMEVDYMDNQEKAVKIDYNLYCKFWALQDFFRNPNQCYNKVQWKTFASHASNVLMAFSSSKLDEIQSKNVMDVVDGNVMTKRNEEETHYFAKYLTNQKLLELQLSDSNFRRYVLVQFLILFQYLNSSVKFKSEMYELKADQIEWINQKVDMVYDLLSETPPDGKDFAKCIKHILAREEYWNSWKNDGCQEFKKPATTISDNIDDSCTEHNKKRNLSKNKKDNKLLGDLVKEAATSNKFIMGNQELSKLWNLYPDNLEACKAKERDFLPALESYFAEAIEQIDPNSMIEEKYKKVNDPNFGWRALRLLAHRSPHFFTHSNNPINKLPEYLEIMIRKIAKDRPDRNTQETLETDNTMENEVDDELLKGTEGDEQNGETDEQNQQQQRETEKPKHTPLTPEIMELAAQAIGPNWTKIAQKLDYRADDIEFFKTEYKTDALRCRNILEIWVEDDFDASVENFIYMLEGLGLFEAAEALQNLQNV